MNKTSSYPSSNQKKYQTSNFLVQWLIANFFKKVENYLSSIEFSSILDAGCGEGEAIARFSKVLPKITKGCDSDKDSIEYAQKRFPGLQFEICDICKLTYKNSSFDLVICFEVLEHLPNPQIALSELIRVTNKLLIVSVPHEPYFRIGSLLRGKYIKTLGNHPEHIQNWNEKSFNHFLKTNCQNFSIKSSFPWLIGFIPIDPTIKPI